jgi:hypothetical protein
MMHALGLHPAGRPVLPVMAMTMESMITAHPATGPIAMPIHKESHSTKESLYSVRRFTRKARKVERGRHADCHAGHRIFPGWWCFLGLRQSSATPIF